MRLAAVLLSGLILVACNAADAQRGERAASSGSGTERSYAVGNFDAVALGGYQNVVITVGGPPSVRAEGDERALEQLEITTRGHQLHIGQKRHSDWSFGGDHGSVTVYVTLPSLTKAAIGGSGDMRIDRVEGQSFEGSIGGSGNMEVGAMRVERADFSVAGSGSIRASGQAERARVSIAGSGDVDLGGVQSRVADVSVVGSGDVSIRASEMADVSVMGSGDVTVAGQARCSVSKMGSGDVRCNA